MTYTIEQINEAWIAFTQPMWVTDTVEGAKQLDKGDFISFFIRYWAEKKNENR